MSNSFSHFSGSSTSTDSALSIGNRYYEQQSSSPNGFRRRRGRRQSFDEFRSGFGGMVGMYKSMKTRLDGPALAPAKISASSASASSSSGTSTTSSSTTSSSPSQKRESFDDFRSGYKGIVSIFKSWIS